MSRERGFTLIELLIVVAIIAILAGISVPALLRARMSANEAGAVGDMRAVSAGEASYASANNGAYGTLACLNAPATCGFGSSTHPFVDAQLASLAPKQGYARSFGAGSVGVGTPDPGLASYVYVATPVTVGQTGQRGFGADSGMRICQTADGSVPPLSGAALATGCVPLK